MIHLVEKAEDVQLMLYFRRIHRRGWKTSVRHGIPCVPAAIESDLSGSFVQRLLSRGCHVGIVLIMYMGIAASAALVILILSAKGIAALSSFAFTSLLSEAGGMSIDSSGVRGGFFMVLAV